MVHLVQYDSHLCLLVLFTVADAVCWSLSFQIALGRVRSTGSPGGCDMWPL